MRIHTKIRTNWRRMRWRRLLMRYWQRWLHLILRMSCRSTRRLRKQLRTSYQNMQRQRRKRLHMSYQNRRRLMKRLHKSYRSTQRLKRRCTLGLPWCRRHWMWSSQRRTCCMSSRFRSRGSFERCTKTILEDSKGTSRDYGTHRAETRGQRCVGDGGSLSCRRSRFEKSSAVEVEPIKRDSSPVITEVISLVCV